MNREEFSLQETWAHVGELYAWIVSLFGAPAAIAARLMLMRKERRDLLAWLGPVEALARRLLLLKALTLPTPNEAPRAGVSGRLAIAFKDRPAGVDGRIELRPMMYTALTYDHRIVDGREAVTFLVRVKEMLEDPARLVLDL